MKTLKLALIAGVAATATLTAGLPVRADHHEGGTAAIVPPEIEYEERVLDNGLRVISLQDRTTANVAVSMWYDVGSKHDPEGRSGFAHLFEHILSRKTVNMPYGMINRLTEDVGGTRNASNWYDRTNYYEIVPAQYLETMLWTHAERMARPVVDPEVFENERNVVKEELRQRVLSPPYGRLFRFVWSENSFDVLPHRRPGIGSIEDLDSATLEDALAFHEAYYGPDTATLIVAGNFEQADLDAMVDEYFADIPRRANPIPLEITAEEPPRTESRRVEAFAPNVPLPVVGATYKAVDVLHPDASALTVLDMIMSSGQNSRYYNALVRTGRATQVSQNLTIVEDGGFIAPYAIVGQGQDIEEVAAALDEVIDQIRQYGVTEAELAEAKNELMSNFLYSRETFSDRAFELGEALVRSGRADWADERIRRINAVTVADVNRVAKDYLNPESRVEIRYMTGEADPSTYANPVPMPDYGSVPAATKAPLALADEADRVPPPEPGEVPDIETPEMVQTELVNGVAVIAAQTTDLPIASLTVVIPGGAEVDPREKAGRADLAAYLVTQGTATLSAEQIAAELERLGASLNANATGDGTIVSLSAPVATFAEAGRLMTEVLIAPSFPQAEFEIAKKQALDGLEITMNEPNGLAGMVSQVALYGDTPYGTLTNGTVQSTTALTRDDLVQYHRTWWHPENATAIMTGGVDPERAIQLANAILGNWNPDGDPPTLPELPSALDIPARTIVVDLPSAGQAAVRAMVPVIPRADDRYYDLYIANTVLGSGSNGRLFQEVRTKRALSYGAYSSFPSRRGATFLTASAQTKNETADEVAKIFLDELDRIGAEAFDAEELEKRKLFVLGSVQRAMETSGGYGGQVANLVLRGLPAAEALRVADQIRGVTPESALAAAADLVGGDRASLVIVGNAAEFIDDLRAIRPDVEVYSAEDLDFSRTDLGGPISADEIASAE